MWLTELEVLSLFGVIGNWQLISISDFKLPFNQQKAFLTPPSNSDVRPRRVAVRGPAGRAAAPLALRPLLQRRRRRLCHEDLHLPHAQPGNVLPLRCPLDG